MLKVCHNFRIIQQHVLLEESDVQHTMELVTQSRTEEQIIIIQNQLLGF